MTIVVGTAGHIDHDKTTLLRALTGIDADRLPEERRRGMTIEVGYAHLVLPGGMPLDFVDVPGHDALVGNMLVGAGEIDAALLVVAADDGPRAQTLEHLELLDALGIHAGLAVVTKADLVDEARLSAVCAAVGTLLGGTLLAGVPVLAVSAEAGTGLAALRDELAALAARLAAAPPRAGGPTRLAIDRVFSIRGRGTIATGSLRGDGVAAGDELRLEPGGRTLRVREVQVHGAAIDGSAGPGRTGLNLAAVEAGALARGQVLTAGPGVEVSDRLLVSLRRPTTLGGTHASGGSHASAEAHASGGAASKRVWPPADGTPGRLHLGTAQVGVRIGRSGREAADLGDGRVTALLRLDAPVAVIVGDPFVLRRPSPGLVLAGGLVLDAIPPRGPARRRVTAERLADLDAAVAARDPEHALAALVDLHGVLPRERVEALAAILPGAAARRGATAHVAPDVTIGLDAMALAAVAAHHAAVPLSVGLADAELRRALATEVRRRSDAEARVTAAVAGDVLDRLAAGVRLVREGDRWHDPDRAAGLPPDLLAAMDRLEAALSVPAPPALAAVALAVGCPPDGLRALEAAGRIVRIEADLAWAAPAYQRLAALALSMARQGRLSPAAFRDATGTSRRFVLAILEDLDRRGILQRTPDGHVPGPRAPVSSSAATEGHP